MAAALLYGLTGAAAMATGDAVFPPGSHVGLVPPAGMQVSGDYSGFTNPDNGSSIVMSEMPAAAYDQLVGGLSEESLATKGLTVTGTCEAAKPAGESTCLRATQEAMGRTYQKWLLVVRFDDQTALTVVTVPQAALDGGDYRVADIDAALATLAYSDAASDPLEALPFAIDEGALLPFQQAMAGSTAVYAAPTEAVTPKPLWVVAGSLGLPADAEDIAFSRTAFQQIASLSDPKISKEQAFDSGVLQGHVVEGRATDTESGNDLYVFQAILVDAAGKYYRTVGLVPQATESIYRPEFFRLLNTLEPR